MNFIEAAAIPENFFTVWYNLFERGQIKKSDTIFYMGDQVVLALQLSSFAKFTAVKLLLQ